MRLFLSMLVVFLTACGGSSKDNSSPQNGSVFRTDTSTQGGTTTSPSVAIPQQQPPNQTGGNIPQLPTNSTVDRYDFSVSVRSSSVVPQEVYSVFQQGQSDIAVELNNTFSLPKKAIQILIQDCGTANAFYAPRDSVVIMCYELLNSLVGFYGDFNNALMVFDFVLSHELGHALIDQYDIPTFNGDEDVADTIAVVLSVQTSETQEELIEGAMGAILTGNYFIASSGGSEIEFFDTHTFAPQRAVNLMCWALGGVSSVGSFPEINAVVNQLIPAGRDCVAEYSKAEREYLNLVGPYLKRR